MLCMCDAQVVQQSVLLPELVSQIYHFKFDWRVIYVDGGSCMQHAIYLSGGRDFVMKSDDVGL